MNNGIAKVIIVVIIGFFVLKTCNIRKSTQPYTNALTQTAQSWEKSPVDDLVRDLSSENNFSIILLDMDSRSGKYFHKYNIIVEKADTVLANQTDWTEVPESFFAINVDNMGMEIVSKKDGKVSKVAAPAGYSNYIGNEKYGHWRQRDGYSFWEFYGQYAFMSSMFNLMTYPARRSYYNDYHRGGYYGSRPYYGPKGSSVYGTKSYTSRSGKSTTWGSKSSSFKNQVRSSVSRSTSASKSRSYSSGSRYSGSSARTSRSSSRYSGSSSRSRSGGFGK
ncbi:hypothetical protein [Saccharicrinis fermentans]|uniref:Uncharacterized protein n=1 Tax=Saccharicrinis fermentans DSM 9555 = JCM 21142 TaxID=869213 RepID=W7XTV0_9BACT|nr:hypothetical protein [Saccharicrinis fermentans]GAF01425.1 hypothetical protein JCM21142_32 [Saccharicrinis fermentans DSM 9555 = JCM 21142]